MDFAELRKGGFMKQIQKDYFAVRLRVSGGNLTLEQVSTIYQVAKKYGNGYVHLTTRQGMEIPFIHLNDIDAVRQELLAGAVKMGVCGGTVRGVMACQGSAMCGHGLVDGKALSAAIDEEFFAASVPGKFKIAVTGCNRSCAKPQENDFGLEGAIRPVLYEDACIGCGVCAENCRSGAITMQDARAAFTQDKCTFCGECVTSCPTAAWQVAQEGAKVWAGGRIGRDPKLGRIVLEFLPLEKVSAVIEASLDFFREHGKTKERFGKTIERIGWEEYREVVRSAAE